jgi:hypothetical protein
VSDKESEDAGVPAQPQSRRRIHVISQSMDCAGVLAHLSDLELKPNGKKTAVDLEDLCSGLDDNDEVEHEEVTVVNPKRELPSNTRGMTR